MGRCYVFECPRCTYTVLVSGGADGGRDCFTRTMQCLDCKELFDAVTHVRRRVSRLVMPVGIKPAMKAPHLAGLRLPAHAAFHPAIRRPSVSMLDRVLPEARRVRWIELELTCPRCAHHRLETWQDPGKCPRCGTFLERTLMPYRTWD